MTPCRRCGRRTAAYVEPEPPGSGEPYSIYCRRCADLLEASAAPSRQELIETQAEAQAEALREAAEIMDFSSGPD